MFLPDLRDVVLDRITIDWRNALLRIDLLPGGAMPVAAWIRGENLRSVSVPTVGQQNVIDDAQLTSVDGRMRLTFKICPDDTLVFDADLFEFERSDQPR